ncbi:MAG: EscU/YscU/HrcU family type III secretion system export apparatus switch protein [Planctomycetes bacterium]|nr:EscU/YscU/HrcU family type III secretion system export apparatus switch protein [Planctomycetota bacterium]
MVREDLEGRVERQLAVALRYHRKRDAAPRIVAKGAGLMAQRILDLARENGVPRHRDDDLVRVLAKLDLDQAIPPRLYGAVAEVLAFVYRMNGQYRPDPQAGDGAQAPRPSPVAHDLAS